MKKKMYLAGSMVGFMWLTCFAQDRNSGMVTSLVANNRIPLVQSSLDLSESHETAFWSLYEQYRTEHEKSFRYNYFDLNVLAFEGPEMDEQEAESCINTLLAYQYNDLALKKEYFDRIRENTNGIIALQFLQTEQLLDLVLKSELHEQTASGKNWKDIMPLFFKNDDKERHNFLKSTLSLNPEADSKFWYLYDRYEFESARITGYGFTRFVKYMDDLSDLTPGQAKQLGEEFLSLLRNEIKLKEKYYIEMYKEISPYVAARFIALEDYIGIFGKIAAYSALN